MVQGTRVGKIISGIILRLVTLALALYLGAYTSNYALFFMDHTLGYQRSSGFFGFTIEHLFLSWFLASIFWVSILFGTLGKKTDYWIIGGSLSIVLFLFQGLSINMYLGLIGVALLGNALGYMLKLARQRWFPKKAL